MTYYKEREKKIPEVKCWYPQTVVYNPIKAGSIDSTDIEPHDFGIVRAVNSTYKTNYKAKGNPLHTIFVGRLSLDTNEKDLENEFSRYGKLIGLRLVKDIVTGISKRYAFIEYETSKMAFNAYIQCKSLVLKNSRVFVDFECGRVLPGWKPRRLGGGFGGEKQSGQLRFGGRYRNFKQPLNLVEFKKYKAYKEENKVKIRPSSSSSSSKKSRLNSSSRSNRSPRLAPLPLTPPSRPIIALPLTPPSRPVIALPLTPPSHSAVPLPLTPPSHSNVPLPLTPPSHPNVVLPLTPPSHQLIALPLTPPSHSNIALPLTPPSHSNVPLPLTPPSHSNVPLPLTPPFNPNPHPDDLM